jgi:hypothetical protein
MQTTTSTPFFFVLKSHTNRTFMRVRLWPVHVAQRGAFTIIIIEEKKNHKTEAHAPVRCDCAFPVLSLLPVQVVI